MNVVALERDDAVPGRPFADPAHTQADVAILEEIRAGLRRRLGSGRASGTWREPGAARHLTVIPDVQALESTAPAAAVGFFGQARADVDHAPIVALERAILERAASFPGLLAYDNVHFADRGQWGNLVVFASEDNPGELAADVEHGRAVGLASRHYDSLRLHRFALPGGTLAPARLRWLRTTYLDFADDPPWRAVRSSAEPVVSSGSARSSRPTSP
jgi:hypothetical protein